MDDSFENDDNVSADMETLQFPMPPIQLYSKYTMENIEKGNVLSPPKPPESSYSCFGIVIDPNEAMLQPLSKQGIESLASRDSHMDSKQVMIKITDSLLVTYLELLEALSTLKPYHLIEKLLNHIETLFINFHDLLNQKRIHQFYESSRHYLYNSYQNDSVAIQDMETTINQIYNLYKEFNVAIKNHIDTIKK